MTPSVSSGRVQLCFPCPRFSRTKGNGFGTVTGSWCWLNDLFNFILTPWTISVIFTGLRVPRVLVVTVDHAPPPPEGGGSVRGTGPPRTAPGFFFQKCHLVLKSVSCPIFPKTKNGIRNQVSLWSTQVTRLVMYINIYGPKTFCLWCLYNTQYV